MNLSVRQSHKQSVLAIAVASAALFAASQNSNAAVDTWIGATSGNWSDATNWQAGTAPANGDDLLFSSQGTTLTTANDNAALSVANITFDSTAPAYTLNGPNAVTLTANVTNASSNLQTLNVPISFAGNAGLLGGVSGLTITGALTDTAATGNQTLTIGGTGTLTDSTLVSNAGGTLVLTTAAGSNWTMLASGTAATLAKGQLNFIGGGTFSFGTATSAPNLTITAVGSDHTVGDANSTSTFNMVNGTLLLKTRINTVNGIVNISGGTFTIWNQFQVANGAIGNSSTINITGGTTSILTSTGGSGGGPLFVASRGNGTLNMMGGNLTVSTLDVSRGAAAATNGTGSHGIVNLNGGMITANTITTASANSNTSASNSDAILNFNGGTLRAKSSTTLITHNTTTNTPITVIVQAGGAVIDSNNFSVSTAEPLQHDPLLGSTIDGGLTKKSAGTLTLSGSNTYTGNTIIKAGSLALSSTTATNNIASSASIIVGDTSASSTAGLLVSGLTLGFHVAPAQTLAGYGIVTGDAVIDGFLAPGNAGAGTLSDTGNSTLSSGAALKYDLNIPSVAAGTGGNDLYAISAGLTLNPNVTLNVTPGASFAPGTYHLATFATDTDNSSNFSGWTVSGLNPALYSTSFSLTSNSLDLVVSNAGAVPEPASLSVLALGAVAMLKRRRK